MNKIELLGTAEECLEKNINLVHKICNKYRNFAYHKRVEYDDILQNGMIGLFKAYQSFETDRVTAEGKAIKFSTFAVPHIIGAVTRSIINHNVGFKVSRPIKDANHLIRKNKMMDETNEVISEKLGLTLDMVKMAKEFEKEKHLDSLDNEVVPGKNDKASNLYEMIVGENDISSLHELKDIIDRLSEKERVVCYMKAEGYSQCEIAEVLKVSQVQVGRYLKKVKEKLKIQLQML